VKPKIAVFAGATATILNSTPLITSDKARQKYGVPLRTRPAQTGMVYDELRPQRLAVPATVYVEQFSAHPLERDARHLHGEPDGYVSDDGQFSTTRRAEADRPVFEVTLLPEDGLYMFPYMARRANGSAWEFDSEDEGAGPADCRQTFYPDASRVFEEINRFVLDEFGEANTLSAMAEFSFFRAAPSGGYQSGLPEGLRTDVGEGDIEPEVLGYDYFPYAPRHLRREPTRRVLAKVTNTVQSALRDGQFDGAIWLEGSPYMEETAYWLNLLIDCDIPIACNAGDIGYPGHHNIIRSVEYICSRIWASDDDKDRVGVVAVQDDQMITAREVMKLDARPGGYAATGGHGGVVASRSEHGEPVLTFVPARKHTFTSDVNLSRLPDAVLGTRRGADGRVEIVSQAIKSADGGLLPDAIPVVSIVKHARYFEESAEPDPDAAVELVARISWNLTHAPLSGFVAEGGVPYGDISGSYEAALCRAAFCGMPVVKVGRGNPEGAVGHMLAGIGIAGSNLTATKARLLLMACLLRFGGLPPANDPANPTDEETATVMEHLAKFQRVFDEH
jgi:L-asparaginase